MRLAIVGSVQLHEHPEAYQIVYQAFERYQPTVLISGGAIGIDTMAEKEAKRRDVALLIHRPKIKAWLRGSEDGFWGRNRRIAQDCDGLVRIACSWSSTYGSGWTRDQARLAGKWTKEHVVVAPAAMACRKCQEPMQPHIHYLPITPPILWYSQCGWQE